MMMMTLWSLCIVGNALVAYAWLYAGQHNWPAAVIHIFAAVCCFAGYVSSLGTLTAHSIGTL